MRRDRHSGSVPCRGSFRQSRARDAVACCGGRRRSARAHRCGSSSGRSRVAARLRAGPPLHPRRAVPADRRRPVRRSVQPLDPRAGTPPESAELLVAPGELTSTGWRPSDGIGSIARWSCASCSSRCAAPRCARWRRADAAPAARRRAARHRRDVRRGWSTRCSGCRCCCAAGRRAALAAAAEAAAASTSTSAAAPTTGGSSATAATSCLQYWFFYAFNDWRSTFAGVNDHEADWELVTVYLAERTARPPEPALGRLRPPTTTRATTCAARWDDPDLLPRGRPPGDLRRRRLARGRLRRRATT